MNRSLARQLKIVLLIAALGLVLPASGALGAKPVQATKQPTATGTGGAVATVDLDASLVGMQVLRGGGNAVDAAVATGAALGVTESYSCGIGGGGFMVIYDADNGSVSTIDSRETAPSTFEEDSFIDPATGEPIPFDQRVTSGLGVVVPGTIRSWEQAGSYPPTATKSGRRAGARRPHPPRGRGGDYGLPKHVESPDRPRALPLRTNHREPRLQDPAQAGSRLKDGDRCPGNRAKAHRGYASERSLSRKRSAIWNGIDS
jgi:hypothetical protein